MDIQASNYFKSLPAMIRESVMQSGKDFNNEAELQAFVAHLESYEV